MKIMSLWKEEYQHRVIFSTKQLKNFTRRKSQVFFKLLWLLFTNLCYSLCSSPTLNVLWMFKCFYLNSFSQLEISIIASMKTIWNWKKPFQIFRYYLTCFGYDMGALWRCYSRVWVSFKSHERSQFTFHEK